jgi:hypothetical protein
METPNSSYPALDFGEAVSSDPSSLSSTPASPSLTLVSTPATSVTDLPKEIKRDPHDTPVFDKGFAHFTQPIFYLPPLLSSLPDTVSLPPPTVSTGRVPKTTKSRLPDIDPASLSLHKALHNFAHVTEDYTTAPYENAFNWNDLELPEDVEREWYSITFRSTRKQGSETSCQSKYKLLLLCH